MCVIGAWLPNGNDVQCWKAPKNIENVFRKSVQFVLEIYKLTFTQLSHYISNYSLIEG